MLKSFTCQLKLYTWFTLTLYKTRENLSGIDNYYWINKIDNPGVLTL